MLLEVVLKQRPAGVTFSAEDTRARFARWYWRLLLWGVVRNGGNEWTLVAGNNVVGGRLVSGGFARARRPSKQKWLGAQVIWEVKVSTRSTTVVAAAAGSFRAKMGLAFLGFVSLLVALDRLAYACVGNP